jgi:hypothetical protein
MLTSSRFNYLIEITQKLLTAVARMRGAYSSFPDLIDEEHKMITTHQYTSRLEEIAFAKSALADEVSVLFDELQQLSQQIFTIWRDEECEGTAIFPGDLSNSIQMLTGIQQAMLERKSDLATNVLQLQISRLSEELEAFKAVASVVKPKIELNRSALSGVVRSYQESTRVMVELCEQAQATYSSQGTQNKASTGTSTIFVRA